MRIKNIAISSFIIFSSTFAEAANEGYRIKNFNEVLKKVYVDANRFEETKIDPSKSGGSTLMGLISRLLGSAPNSTFEGMGVQRYVYSAFRGQNLLGVSHGSSVDADGALIHVVVHYDADANVKGVEILDAPEEVAAAVKSHRFLDQFKGYATEDFQIKYQKQRRRVISHQGRALKEIKTPSTGIVKNYFDRILRSVRYNVAFVDVAYFISRLPMLDTQSRRISSVSMGSGSPEAMVKSAKMTSPSGDRSKNFVPQLSSFDKN
jgi:hypothetical protein